MAYLIMTKPGCNYCTRAKALLKSNQLTFSESHYDTPEKQEKFKAAGWTSYPQIFHEGVLVGGYDDLVEYLDF
ncbi:glutaredoxin domain-containing protein [Agrobacterium sp. CG674]